MTYITKTAELKVIPQDLIAMHDVVFMESGHSPIINNYITHNLKAIKDMFEMYDLNFYYLPCLDMDMNEVIKYYSPYLDAESVNKKHWGNDTFLKYLKDKRLQKNMPPCLISKYDYSDTWMAYFFTLTKEAEIIPCFKELREAIDYDLIDRRCMHSSIEESDGVVLPADDTFDRETLALMDEVKQKIERLRTRGVSEWALRQLVEPEIKLSRLVITEDFKIFLPDYGNMEIKMEPLVKSVYLLFLRHREGIMFKCLPDYRDELYNIYIEVRACSASPSAFSEEKTRKSIEDVTDPLSNSINEKCARIREAFISQFDDRLAQSYYVTGRRGCPKCITIPRNLVRYKHG